MLRGIIFLIVILALGSCARMGNPDGGWYDETPPYVVSASPKDKGVEAKSGKVKINFSEFIKLENATEKVVISPPQMEQADIKATGKRIVVDIKDSLKANTTYTIDFSDAIVDNNESNPMGNYTYSFSTGSTIDTLEVSGKVLTADNLEPVKGILVGLTSTDSVGGTMLRVSRTDSRGQFIIRGIAPGDYCCYALNDQDGNYRFSQRSEKLAFNHEVLTPMCKADTRQDTLWIDTLHIKDIQTVGYTHFLPDDITLLAFDHEVTDRYYTKTERLEPDHFTSYYSGPSGVLPKLRLLEPKAMDADEAFVTEASFKKDTITYWLRDTALVNADTLTIEMTYEMTDTLGKLVMNTDTIEVLAKTPYAKRMKAHNEEVEKFEKKLAKMRKRGEEITDSIFPEKRLEPKYAIEQSMAPNGVIRFTIPTPLAKMDTAGIHMYCMIDSVWYRAPFQLERSDEPSATDRDFVIDSEWRPGVEYSFEVDTLVFEDIYGKTSTPFKTGFKINTLDVYASLFVNVTGIDSANVVVQLLDKGDKTVMQVPVEDGTAEFYYVKPGVYYMRAFIDENGNGKWDTGNFYEDRQPERVYYYNNSIECKAKWDITKSWNLTAIPLLKQKPSAITKQKADKAKTVKMRNAQRAREKGVAPPSN